MDNYYTLIPWDTGIIGGNVFEMQDSFEEDSITFKSNEDKLVGEKSPYMVFCKTNSDNISRIHFLEEMGFRYVETQLHMVKRIKGLYEIKRSIQYSLAGENEVNQIADMAKSTFLADRYSIDPFIGREVSGKRYANWIKSTFGKENFFLYKYTTGRDIVGFHLLKIEKGTASALLGGLSPDCKGVGMGLDIFLLLNNFLHDLGIKAIDTYISAINTGIFNILMFMQFQVKDVRSVLRKIYL